MSMFSLKIHSPVFVAQLSSGTNRACVIRSSQSVAFNHHVQSSNPINGMAASLSSLLHRHVEAPTKRTGVIDESNDICRSYEQTLCVPENPRKEVIASVWREMHGSKDWDNLLDPLHPWLQREIIKYGEFAEATYDAFDGDRFSEYCGSCKYHKRKLLDAVGLSGNGYEVTEHIHAMSHQQMPRWMERSHLVNTWSKDSNWIGFVAVSNDEETKRIGRRDIVVAWRGTVAPSEWYDDLQRKLEPLGNGGEARVEHGFLSMYTSKNGNTRYNKRSASEQAMTEIRRLVDRYSGEEVSLTITGHSLGGALALLNAYEAAKFIPGIHISVISFGSPRVGNAAFRDELHRHGVKILRVVLEQDIVPKMPGFILNESLEKFEDITGKLEWIYAHAGIELRLDASASPYLKQGFHPMGYHLVETYLHLVDGFSSTGSGFRADPKRDVALVNKGCDLLVDELRIPPRWHQPVNKGLVRNEYGRWVRPRRDPEDIPSPARKTA